MEDLERIVESIIFVSEDPVPPAHILGTLQKVANSLDEDSEGPEQAVVTKEEVEEALGKIQQKYQAEDYAFELRKIANGYQFLTKQAYFPYVKQSRLEHNQKRLSRSALETLSIIAYRQPVTKAEIEFIRGVNSDYATQKLLEKKLVSIVGRSDGPGKPLLYGTSSYFMQYFGIGELQDLPKLKEFEELEEVHLEKFRQFQEVKDTDTPVGPKEEKDAETETQASEEN